MSNNKYVDIEELGRYFKAVENWEKSKIDYSPLRHSVIISNITKNKYLKKLAFHRYQKMFDEFLKNYIKTKDYEEAVRKTIFEMIGKKYTGDEEDFDYMVQNSEKYLHAALDLEFVLEKRKDELEEISKIIKSSKKKPLIVSNRISLL